MQSQRHGRSVALALLTCLLGASAARPQNPPAPALVIRDVTVVSPERAAPRDAPEVVGVDRLGFYPFRGPDASLYARAA